MIKFAEAQNTVGTILHDHARRDAIHFAVSPVVADEQLLPGQRIALVPGSTERATSVGTSIGIVDPFLTAAVEKG